MEMCARLGSMRASGREGLAWPGRAGRERCDGKWPGVTRMPLASTVPPQHVHYLTRAPIYPPADCGPASGPCHVCCYLQVFAIQQAFTRRDEALKEMAFLKAQVGAWGRGDLWGGVRGRVCCFKGTAAPESSEWRA
mgnify:CR=1 FL=1